MYVVGTGAVLKMAMYKINIVDNGCLYIQLHFLLIGLVLVPYTMTETIVELIHVCSSKYVLYWWELDRAPTHLHRIS